MVSSRVAAGLPLALLLWASVGGLGLLGPSRASLLSALFLYSAALVALLLLWRRHPAFLDDPRILLGGALLLRLTLFPTIPDLSDDLYRYVWDGWLSASGVNPFLYVPSDPTLAAFQNSDLFPALNSPDYYSVYPPLSQLVFLGGGFAYAQLGWPAAAYAVKAGFLLLEGVGILCLFLALRASGSRVGTLALYAWNPLVLVTVAGSAHTEGGLVLGMGLLALGVAGGGRRRAWIGLMLAVASKGVPILVAPLLLRRHLREDGWNATLRNLAPAVVLGVALAAPWYAPGVLGAVATSVDLYVRLFEFNGGPYLLLKEGIRVVTGEDYGRVLGPALRALLLVFTAWIWLRWPVRSSRDWCAGALLILGLYLATATTVHPWYLLWGLAFVPLTPFLRGAWLWASWAAFPTYLTYVGAPHGLLSALFWGGVGVVLLVESESRVRDILLRWAGRRKARQVAPFLSEGTVLDLGAGEGYVSLALRDSGSRPILMDLGPYFRVPLPGVVYDGLRVPLRDGAVDTVLLSLALHHAEDPDRVLGEALRVARSRVVITESTYRWGWERRALEVVDGWANRGRGMDAVGETPPLGFRTVPEWEAAFRRAGAELRVSRRLNRIGHRHHIFVLDLSIGG